MINGSLSSLDRQGGSDGVFGVGDEVVDDKDPALDDGEEEQDETEKARAAALAHDVVGGGNPAALSLQAATDLGGVDVPTTTFVVAAASAAGDGSAGGAAGVHGAPAAAVPGVEGGGDELNTSPSSAAAAGEPTSSPSCLGDFNFSSEVREGVLDACLALTVSCVSGLCTLSHASCFLV